MQNARAVFASFEARGSAVGLFLICTCELMEQALELYTCSIRADVQESQGAFSASCLLLLEYAPPSPWLSVATPESKKPRSEARTIFIQSHAFAQLSTGVHMGYFVCR